MGSPYPSKEAVPQAIVPPLALSARRRKPPSCTGLLEKGGKGNGRETVSVQRALKHNVWVACQRRRERGGRGGWGRGERGA